MRGSDLRCHPVTVQEDNGDEEQFSDARQKSLTQKAVVVFEIKMRHSGGRFIFQQLYHHDCGAESVLF